MHYLLYFIGPCILAVVGAKLLRQPYRVFGLGVLGFLLSWVIDQSIASVSLRVFSLSQQALLYGAIVALSAGVFEELARYAIFSLAPVFRANRNARSAFMYALGHHGMETIIVGATVALMVAVYRYKPDLITDAAVLQQCRDAASAGIAISLYQAVERLSVGLLIHVCFSGVVMLAVARRQPLWLFAAIGWHFAHDMVGFSLQHASAHWAFGKSWVLLVVLVYSYVATRIYRALGASDPAASSAIPSSAILPGRT